MDTSRARSTLKTYSRSKRTLVEKDTRTAKRRRVESPTSSDKVGRRSYESSPGNSQPNSPCAQRLSSPLSSQTALFSDSILPATTPPSSPPPIASATFGRGRPTVFAWNRRTRALSCSKDDGEAAPQPLRERASNTSRPTAAPAARKKQRLVQMKIDLGGQVRTTCKVCGMSYIPSDSEDAALHKRFHESNVGGVDIPKAFLKYVGANNVWSGEGGCQVVGVSRRDSLATRNVARRALAVVNAELSAVDIPDERLWSQVKVPDIDQNGVDKGSSCDRFRVYLYICGSKCVGLCLVERIFEAAKVMEGQTGVSQSKVGIAKSSSISITEETDSALLGISRIWTCHSHRRKGIAKVLLDCVVESFLHGIRVGKDLVAFSQPTESGGQLARRWFGKESGWHVYIG